MRPRGHDGVGYILINGRHRLEAMRKLGRDAIRAEIVDCTDTEALLMECAELSRAERDALLRATKPVTEHDPGDAARIAALEAEVAKLKAKLASMPKVEERVEEPGDAAGSVPAGKVYKVLLKLADADDNTVLVAARTLVRIFEDAGCDIRVLADNLREQFEKRAKGQAGTAAADRLVRGQSRRHALRRRQACKMTYNALLKALYAEVPALRGQSSREADGYIGRCLHDLGFTPSSSMLSWQRSEAKPANAAANPTR